MSDHVNRIDRLIVALKESKIYADAEFNACCNDGDYIRAVYFSSIRDTLIAQITVLENYRSFFVNDKAMGVGADRCPICGSKTSESAKEGVGKICFDCVNEMRGIR